MYMFSSPSSFVSSRSISQEEEEAFVRSFVRSSTGSPAERGGEPPSANATRRYPASTRLDSRAPHPIRVDNKSHIFRVLTASSSPLRAKQTGRVFAFIRNRRIRVGGALLNANRLRIISSKAPSHRIHPRRHLDPSVSRIAYRIDVYIYLRTFRSSSPPRSSSSSSSFVRSFVRSFLLGRVPMCVPPRACARTRQTDTDTDEGVSTPG